MFLLAIVMAVPSNIAAIRTEAAQNTSKSKILIAYFGRYGNTNFEKDVDATSSASIVLDGEEKQGTTEYLARQIQKQVGGDLFLIQTKKKYPVNFDKLVVRAERNLSDNSEIVFRRGYTWRIFGKCGESQNKIHAKKVKIVAAKGGCEEQIGKSRPDYDYDRKVETKWCML